MNHYQKLKSLLLLLCLAITAKAQLSNGKVYNFVNVGKGTSMSITANGVIVSGTNQSNKSQLWYAASEGNGFTLRNLANGHYLKSPNATSKAWSTVKVKDENCVFSSYLVSGSNYAIRVTGNSGGYNYMHADGGNTIVCWNSSDQNSQWTMNVVDIDAATLNANWNELASIDPSAETTATYQTHLDNLFSDKACTTLKKSFANENAVKNDADYKALPTTLQEMVLKVYKDSWAEDNHDENKSDWDADYAKRYRVQLYEPYNEPEAAASALGINAHSNLNNPTGIFANDREALYVMVEGEIKTGASLYITSYTGNGNLGGYDNGVELKQGLNIVPSFGDGNNFCINYVVHTFDTSKGKGNKAKACCLSDFEDLKIHIEGGYINGYYNKVGDKLYTPDQGTNWDYLEARATQTTVTILGKYITLQFPLHDAIDNDGNTNKGMSYYLDQSNVEGIIDEWDNVMLWERLVLGLLDEKTTNAEAKKSPYSTEERVFDYTGNDGEFAAGYEDYYNVHGLSLGVGYNYMYGGWDHCGYHYNTMESILTNLPYNAGAHWGPGHEIGHQHQNLLTVNGLTEVTNNLFANVVLWYYGETTSRVNDDEGSLSHVLDAFNTEDSDFFTNNIWAQTHLYYKLFLYYHVLGHNTKFYPRLFEMLRQDPMSGGYNQNGATSLLHFYKKCCLASGDDLTEFFRAYGFFSVMDNRLVGDYSNSVYTTTQADIDAAIKEVKDLGYDENIAVLFINDATGETIKSHKGDNLELYGGTTVCAEVGSYASFTENTTPGYTYSVSGTTVTMDGTGGTGFAIFNEKGEIIAFSDKKTFEISSECAVALASGKAEVKAVQADNTIVEATDVMDTDNAEAKYEALGELLTATADLLTYADADNSKPGFYRASVMETLQQLYDEAQSVYDNKEVASYATTYAALAQEYTRIAALDTDKTPFLPGSTYVLTNKKYPNVSMTLYNNALIASATNMSNSAQQWTFEATDEADIYYLKNGSNYLGSLLQSTQVGVTTKELASRYKLFDLGKGLWALQCQNDLEKLMSLHCNSSYKIVGWTHTATDNDGSWWYLTATAKDESMLPLYDLQNLVEKTEALVDEMATVQYKGGAIDMSTCTITSNATETGHETKYLTDGNPNTFFHTVWSGSVVYDYHNIVIDLGEGHSLAEFALNYTTLPTTSNNVDAPESLIVQGSNDGSSYTDIASLSALYGLPTTKGAEYTSSTLGTSSQAYRYIRLQVETATGGKLGNYYYFGLAELALLRMTTLVDAIGDKYQNFITADALKAACDQVYAAQQTIASGSATSDDVEALQAQYDILLAAYENANNVEFNAKKQELLDLIANTNVLINTCGTVTLGENRTLTLSTSSGVGDARLTQWSSGSSEGSLANLYDGNVGTYYVSNWNAVNAAPYLQVYFNDGVGVDKFTFTFTGRKDGNAPTPTTIVVSGSNNGSTFTEIETFTKDGTWPAAANNQTITPRTWTSPTITTTTAYKYLRFTVTAAERSSGNVNNYYGYCHYGISEFGVNRVVETSIELSDEHGEATEELLLTTYQAVQTAQDACNRATTETQLQNALESLLTAKDALHSAMYSNVEYTISVVGAANGGVQYEGQNYTESLSAPATLTIGELSAIVLDGYVAEVTLEGQTISIIYNKVYTVNVVGGNDQGGVVFGNDNYTHGQELNALNLINENLTAIDLGTDYSVDKIEIGDNTITVTYKKRYIVEVIGLDGQGGVVFEDNEYFDGDELYALDLDDLAAISLGGCYTEGDIVIEGATITITYMKKYTVHLYGEGGTGIIFYDDKQYQNGDIIIALGNIDNRKIGVLGDPIYYHESVEVDHDLGTISVYYTFDKSDVVDYEATTNQLVTNAAGVLDETEIASFEAIIAEIRTRCENASLYTVYSAALDDWATANDEFAAAIENAKMGAVEAAKNDLRSLIAQTTALINQCGTVEYGTTTTPVKLQTESAASNFWISTNADQNVVGNANDGEGIAALLDGSINTYMHTQWGGDAVNDDHYVQVSLGSGQGLAAFTFTYATRYVSDPTYNSPAPSVIEVYGSADGTDFTDLLATFTSDDPDNALPLYTEAGVYWTSAMIEPNENYEYLRFYVKKSSGPGNVQHGNRYFFAMSEFALASIGEEGWNVNLNADIGCVTKEQLFEIYQANIDAATLANESAVKEDLVAEKESLQALYDALLDASRLPVRLTTDANAPVLYTIKTKRDGGPVLQYDETSGKFAVATAVENSATQAFYFMKGDMSADGNTQQVYIYPYMAGGKVLAADNVDNGDAKAFAKDKGTFAYEQWVFVARADGYYNLQTVGETTTYLSNIYSASHMIGFYSEDPESDLGSLFKFEETSVVGGLAYLRLKNYFENEVKVVGIIEYSTAVGYYPEELAAPYNTAYNAATEALANTETTTEAEFQTIYTDLVAANEALVMNMPSADKYYRFVSADTQHDARTNGIAYADPKDNKMYWSKEKGTSDATAIWSITASDTEGKYNVINLHTGSSINGFINYNPSPLSETAGDVNIVSLSGDGQVGIKCNGTMMHAADADKAVVSWSTGANDASAWRIVEVTEAELNGVQFALKIGALRHTSLYLNYAAEIPEGVQVYIAHTPDGEEGTILADELEGKVLPARTAVIVKGDAATYNFKYTEEKNTIDDLSANLLGGSAYLKFQEAKEGYLCCNFAQKDNVVGLYKNYIEYIDANGSQTRTEGEGDDAITTSYVDTDNGTHFKISANKIYYEYERSAVGGAAAFRFRFNTNETTELDGLIIDEDATIYNLCGQRLLKVVEPGIYIINGKKTFVTEKMIRNND